MGKGDVWGGNGDSDLRWSYFFRTFVCLGLAHTVVFFLLFFFKTSTLLLSRLSFVGLYFMFACLCRLSRFFSAELR